MSDADLIRAVEILNRHPGWDASPFAGDDVWLIPADMAAFTAEEQSELWSLGWIPFPGGGYCSVRWDRAKDGTVTERPDWKAEVMG